MSAKLPYRLISFSNCHAAENMAIDEAILEAHLKGDVPPTLRVYQFSPPAVSFGYAQKIDNDLIEKVQKQNLAVVRRPTGGRAVLHMGDLTYAFICSSKSAPISNYALVDESVTTAYKQICHALILALDSLGIAVTFGQKNGRYQDKHDCFLATTIADLQYAGRKIAGSAQLRRRYAVLQHGSIILNQPQSLLQELLSNNRTNGQMHHANLFEISNHHFSFAELEKAIKYGFELAFGNQFLAASLTKNEKERVRELLFKYNSL